MTTTDRPGDEYRAEAQRIRREADERDAVRGPMDVSRHDRDMADRMDAHADRLDHAAGQPVTPTTANPRTTPEA